MFKKVLKLFYIILVVLDAFNQANNEFISEKRLNRWLFSCSQANCLNTIDKCVEDKCLGEQDCMNCMIENRYECKQCVTEIYNKLVLINGELICAENDELHQSVCQLYCRGIFYQRGNCQRNDKNIPICDCQVKETSSTKKTMTSTNTPKIVVINNDIECKLVH
jgi:hypothetical protein